MLTRSIVEGKPAVVATLSDGLVKIVWDDGRIAFAVKGAPARVAQDFDPQAQDAFDPEEPRKSKGEGGGEWTSSGAGAGVEEKAHGPAPALKGSKSDEPMEISPRAILGKGQGAAQKAEVASRKGQYLPMGLSAMREDPAVFKKNMALLRNGNLYPYFRAADMKGSDEAVAKAAVEQMRGNLEFLVALVPPKVAKSWAGWYEGANHLAKGMSKQYGISVAQASGVIASLSPTRDWNTNVDMAMDVCDTLRNHAQDPWDGAMDETAARIWTTPAQKAILAQVHGRKLADLTNPAAKAVWIRTWDQAHKDQSFRLVEPDGELDGQMKTKKGAPAPVIWQSISCVASAVICLESRDREAISKAMGGGHKVRSFYNNILNPDSPNGDVTIDTHAVGAALMYPSTGETVPVWHALGAHPAAAADKPEGFVGASGSDIKGVRGMYPLYAEAYREAAKDLKLEPRQLQSIVWEIKQRLFSNGMTGSRMQAAIDGVWRRYHNGEFSLARARNMVVEEAPKLMDPDVRDANIAWKSGG